MDESTAETVRQQISKRLYLLVKAAWVTAGEPGTFTEYLEQCAERGLPAMKKAAK